MQIKNQSHKQIIKNQLIDHLLEQTLANEITDKRIIDLLFNYFKEESEALFKKHYIYIEKDHLIETRGEELIIEEPTFTPLPDSEWIFKINNGPRTLII